MDKENWKTEYVFDDDIVTAVVEQCNYSSMRKTTFYGWSEEEWKEERMDKYGRLRNTVAIWKKKLTP